MLYSTAVGVKVIEMMFRIELPLSSVLNQLCTIIWSTPLPCHVTVEKTHSFFL